MSYVITQPYSYTGNISVTGTSGSGSIFTVGANGTSATDMWTNTNWTTAVPTVTVNQKATIDLKGKDADIVINGESLKDAIREIKEALRIPNRLQQNSELEQSWDELQAAADHYNKLLVEYKEKQKVWETLKKQDL